MIFFLLVYVVRNNSSPDRQDGQTVVPAADVDELAPIVEVLVPRKVEVVLGQPEEPGGNRAVAVAGENILERAFVFNGVYIFSLFARWQSPALQFARIVMSQGFWFFQNPAGFSIGQYAPVYLAFMFSGALYSTNLNILICVLYSHDFFLLSTSCCAK
jgi:hypothetical protein